MINNNSDDNKLVNKIDKTINKFKEPKKEKKTNINPLKK